MTQETGVAVSVHLVGTLCESEARLNSLMAVSEVITGTPVLACTEVFCKMLSKMDMHIRSAGCVLARITSLFLRACRNGLI